MAANIPPLEVVNRLLVDLIARAQNKRHEAKVDWDFVAALFKDVVTNEDSPDRDIFTRYRNELQFNRVSLKKAVMEWTGKGSVSQVLSLPEIEGIEFEFKLYVAVAPESLGRNEIRSTELAEVSENSKGRSTPHRSLKKVNSQEAEKSGSPHNEKCPCSGNRKLSNSDVDRKSRELAAERSENLDGHREKQAVEGSSSGAKAESTERQSKEPEEAYDPLQKAADFLMALIKRTAESQNWPLVNWLDVQRRYRDLVAAVSDNDLYNKYRKYLDFHRRHLDGQQLMTWTGACELEQLVIKPYFGKIGLIRDGFPPADLFVMVDSPEAPISKIYDYTECKRRMEAAGDGKTSTKISPAEPEQPDELSMAERVQMLEFFNRQTQLEKQHKQWYNKRGQGHRGRGDYSAFRGRGRPTINNSTRGGFHSRNNNVEPSRRFNNSAAFETRRSNDANANQLPQINASGNIGYQQRRDSPPRSRVLPSPQYIPNAPASSTSSSVSEPSSPEPEDGVYTDDEIAMEEAAQKVDPTNEVSDPSKDHDEGDRRREAHERPPSNNQPHTPLKELETVCFIVEKNTRLPLNTQPAETGKCTPSKEVHSGDHTFHSNENRGNNVYYSVPLRSRTLKSTNPEAVACGSARQPRDVLARANEKPPEVVKLCDLS